MKDDRERRHLARLVRRARRLSDDQAMALDLLLKRGSAFQPVSEETEDIALGFLAMLEDTGSKEDCRVIIVNSNLLGNKKCSATIGDK